MTSVFVLQPSKAQSSPFGIGSGHSYQTDPASYSPLSSPATSSPSGNAYSGLTNRSTAFGEFTSVFDLSDSYGSATWFVMIITKLFSRVAAVHFCRLTPVVVFLCLFFWNYLFIWKGRFPLNTLITNLVIQGHIENKTLKHHIKKQARIIHSTSTFIWKSDLIGFTYSVHLISECYWNSSADGCFHGKKRREEKKMEQKYCSCSPFFFAPWSVVLIVLMINEATGLQRFYLQANHLPFYESSVSTQNVEWLLWVGTLNVPVRLNIGAKKCFLGRGISEI